MKEIIFITFFISLNQAMEQEMGPTSTIPDQPTQGCGSSAMKAGEKCCSPVVNTVGDIFCGFDSSICPIEIFPNNSFCKTISACPCCWVTRFLVGDRGLMPAFLCNICCRRDEHSTVIAKSIAQEDRSLWRLACLSAGTLGGCIAALAT